jgi:hypothetical protein
MQLEEGAILNGTVHMSESKRSGAGRPVAAVQPPETRDRKAVEAAAPSH